MPRLLRTLLLGCALSLLGASLPARAADPPAVGPPGETAAQRDARMAWWREAPFGMFIHWGVYAVPAGMWNGKPVGGGGEWILTQGHIPLPDYEKLAAQFNPTKFDADQWAQIAQDAGMKYLVITAKHHDGFCMFKTDTTKYNIVDATPWHQDPLALLSAACRRHGIRFCCYYSIMDWHTPDQLPAKADPVQPTYNPTSFDPAAPEKKAAYITYMKAQLKDLITQYHPGLLWFDGGWMKGWTEADGKDLLTYLYALDPQLIINDRTRGGGDYGTPEQKIPANGLPGKDWETCMTINGTWGYKSTDLTFKSPATLLRNLIDIASKGGNYLLNVGPTGEGEIPAGEVQSLQGMGDWLKVNGEAIYGASASPFAAQLPWGRCTRKGNTLYFSVLDWPKDGVLTAPLASAVTKAYLLTDRAHSLTTSTGNDTLTIRLPATAPDPIASVAAVEVMGEVKVAKGIDSVGIAAR